jgi:hypothetical protein
MSANIPDNWNKEKLTVLLRSSMTSSEYESFAEEFKRRNPHHHQLLPLVEKHGNYYSLPSRFNKIAETFYGF